MSIQRLSGIKALNSDFYFFFKLVVKNDNVEEIGGRLVIP